MTGCIRRLGDAVVFGHRCDGIGFAQGIVRRRPGSAKAPCGLGFATWRCNLKKMALALCAGLFATNSYGAIIDFRDSSFDPGGSFSSIQRTFAGIGMTISTNLRTLHWDSTDGFGIRGGTTDDEIDSNEELTVTFDNAVDLTQITLTDLFRTGLIVPSRERGTFDTDVSVAEQFEAELNQFPILTNGVKVIDTNQSGAKSIVFRAVGASDDFSVRGLVATELDPQSTVPEPSSWAIMAMMVAAFWFGMRRKLQSATA